MPKFTPRVKVYKLTGKEKEEVNAMLAKHRKDVDFYHAHYKELLKKYPDQWVGVLDEEVKGVAKTRPELRAKFKAEGIPMNYMYVRRLSTKPKPLITRLWTSAI